MATYDTEKRVAVDLSSSAPMPNFKFWGHETFMNNLLEQRTVYSRGRVRGGKTLLCTALAYEMARQGYVKHLWANYPMRFVDPIVPPLRSGVMVLDEAAEFFDAREHGAGRVKDYLRYLGKFGLWLLLPSVHSVDVRARALIVERKWNLGKAYFYKWWLEQGSSKDGGSFFLINPTSIWSCYNTHSVTRNVTPDAGFADALDVTIAHERATQGGWNGLDFYLPWFSSGEYSPSDDIPYSVDVLDKTREAWGRKGKVNREVSEAIVGQAAKLSKIPDYPE